MAGQGELEAASITPTPGPPRYNGVTPSHTAFPFTIATFLHSLKHIPTIKMSEYNIAIPDAALERLRQKLALTRFPDEVRNNSLLPIKAALTPAPARRRRMGLRSTTGRHQTPHRVLGERVRLASARSKVERAAQFPSADQARRLPRTRHPLRASALCRARCHPALVHPWLAGVVCGGHEDVACAAAAYQRRLVPRCRA